MGVQADGQLHPFLGYAPVTAESNYVNGAPVDLLAAHNAANPGNPLREGAGWTPVLRTRVDVSRVVPTLVTRRVVRDTWMGPGIDSTAPYGDMRGAHPWQDQRFAEYRNNGPGARITVPAERPQLAAEKAHAHTHDAYFGTWVPEPFSCRRPRVAPPQSASGADADEPLRVGRSMFVGRYARAPSPW
ncbi:hypothetical protein [Streptomyces spiramyceticus]|uniref:hypothetical protein n=1 Tax=Streptomyces spiramyceticus TaxID=299717 RepID=UPI003B75CD7C